MEERIITLEKRYVRSQNELASSSESNERTQTELKSFVLTIAQVGGGFVVISEPTLSLG